jgi:hypothetical protein
MCFSNNWIFASWTKNHFDPFKWYFNDIRYYMGVQSIFGLVLQLNWKKTTFVTREAKIQLLEKPRENRKIWQNYQRIMSLLHRFIHKNRVNVSYISFIEPIASFHEILEQRLRIVCVAFRLVAIVQVPFILVIPLRELLL